MKTLAIIGIIFLGGHLHSEEYRTKPGGGVVKEVDVTKSELEERLAILKRNETIFREEIERLTKDLSDNLDEQAKIVEALKLIPE